MKDNMSTILIYLRAQNHYMPSILHPLPLIPWGGGMGRGKKQRKKEVKRRKLGNWDLNYRFTTLEYHLTREILLETVLDSYTSCYYNRINLLHTILPNVVKIVHPNPRLRTSAQI